MIVLLLREPIVCRLIWLLAAEAEAEAAVKNNDHMRAIDIQINCMVKSFS